MTFNMIIVEIKCPDCNTIQLFHSTDFEDTFFCKTCNEEKGEAWQIPHRPRYAVDIIDNSGKIRITKFNCKWNTEKGYYLKYSEHGRYPYYNDSLEFSYEKFMKLHKLNWVDNNEF